MIQISIKETVQDLPRLLDKDPETIALIHTIRPWMFITGLEFHHVILLPVKRLIGDLRKVSATIGAVVDVFDETQAQEAACRAIAKIDIITEVVIEGVVSQRVQPLEWDGKTWHYFSDPVLHLKESAQSYVQARDAILRMEASE